MVKRTRKRNSSRRRNSTRKYYRRRNSVRKYSRKRNNYRNNTRRRNTRYRNTRRRNIRKTRRRNTRRTKKRMMGGGFDRFSNEYKKLYDNPEWVNTGHRLYKGRNPFCLICDRDFSRLSLWKHHCRRCGMSVCGDCSQEATVGKLDKWLEDKKPHELQEVKNNKSKLICNLCANGGPLSLIDESEHAATGTKPYEVATATLISMGYPKALVDEQIEKGAGYKGSTPDEKVRAVVEYFIKQKIYPTGGARSEPQPQPAAAALAAPAAQPVAVAAAPPAALSEATAAGVTGDFAGDDETQRQLMAQMAQDRIERYKERLMQDKYNLEDVEYVLQNQPQGSSYDQYVEEIKKRQAPTAVHGVEPPQPSLTPASPPLQLPPGWDMRYTKDRRPYYVDHNTQTTHWDPPPALHQQSEPEPQPAVAALAARAQVKSRVKAVFFDFDDTLITCVDIYPNMNDSSKNHLGGVDGSYKQAVEMMMKENPTLVVVGLYDGQGDDDKRLCFTSTWVTILLRRLREQGIKLYICSSGRNANILRDLLKHNNLPEDTFENPSIEDGGWVPKSSAEDNITHKVPYIQEVMAEEGYSPEEILFVDDYGFEISKYVELVGMTSPDNAIQVKKETKDDEGRVTDNEGYGVKSFQWDCDPFADPPNVSLWPGHEMRSLILGDEYHRIMNKVNGE